jgi:hypothetical protein
MFIIDTQSLALENKVLESQPEILYKFKKINKQQNKIALKVQFNRAVLYLEQKKYKRAIKIFKRTEKIMKVPSWLNIGIAYYKLNSQNNAYLYLKKIYDVKEAITQAPYSYMSASYYLYKLTNNKKFVEEIIRLTSNKKLVNEHTKRLVVDVYIELKKYKKALKILETMDYPVELKRAMLYIKTKQFSKATIHLEKALSLSINDKIQNKILWIKIFNDLKANNFALFEEDIMKISKRKRFFNTNNTMPIKLFFNKNKFTHKEYFKKIIKFDINRKIDFIFYFAPYIFADNDEVKFETGKAFLLKDKKNIKDLAKMIQYNYNLISIIKKDPIKRVFDLQQIINKRYDTYAYEYYNLGLAYAQIDDFNKAHKYFLKAYNFKKANKLYAIMSLISAKRANIDVDEDLNKQLLKNVLSQKGIFQYYGQFIYKIIYNVEYIPNKDSLLEKYKKSIFFRSLYFLDGVNTRGIRSDEPLLQEFGKNPLVFLLKLIAKRQGETKYLYISRIQDSIPVVYNHMFVKGAMLVTRYYIDILKAVGMFHIANLTIDNDTSATYYRTKALVLLYNKNPKSAIKLIEYLQKEYDLKDRYTYLLLTAALIDNGEFEDAMLVLYEAKSILGNDGDVEFLLGIKFLNEMKINSSIRQFKKKYNDNLIDFKIVGFDKLLSDI